MSNRIRFETLAKIGYAARGTVFLLVAGLALFSGVTGGRPETKSALGSVLQQPFGRVWLALIGLALLGFVAWRLAQSIADSDGHGSDGKALAIRAALCGSAFTYFGLAAYAASHAISASAGGEGGGEKGLAHWIMSQPFGSYLAMAVGIGFIGGGIATILKGVTRKFERYLQLPAGGNAIAMICIYGLVARGIVFAITGVLFGYAGFRVDPEQAGSMADALEWVQKLPFGSILYVIVAVGLAAFGVYNLVEARYRVIRKPSIANARQALPFKS